MSRIGSDIRIFVTGGTFDKEYNELDGTLYFKNSHVDELLTLGRCKIPVHVATLMMVDSLDMTPASRQVILKQCIAATEDQIIITHGTDTMVETAHLLGTNIKDKTIVLTGAMIPIKFGSSDGLFNMGTAIAYVQTLPVGVYVVMGGEWFPWNDVRKNRQLGLFERLAE